MKKFLRVWSIVCLVAFIAFMIFGILDMLFWGLFYFEEMVSILAIPISMVASLYCLDTYDALSEARDLPVVEW